VITGSDITSSPGVMLTFKIAFISFAAFYFIFSLIIIRQVSLMAETVRTQFGKVLKFLSLVFALASLGILIYFVMKL